MKIRLNSPVSLDKFTHNKETRSFVAAASDLGNFNIFQRIYDDAADVGFMVCNPNTNTTILVTLVQELADYENNEVIVCGWDFTPCENDVKANPKLRGYSFRIIND